jgi:hypothetical protein
MPNIKNIEEILNLKSPIEYNIELDKYLTRTSILPVKVLHRFYDAYSYEQATSINWAISKLKLIKNRVETGEIICLADSDEVLSKRTFGQWVKTHFPLIYRDVFYV